MLTFQLLYNIVTGALTPIVAAIIALGFPNGTAIIGGHLIFDTTNNASPVVYSDTIPVVGVNKGGLNQVTNGVQTGAVLQVNGVTDNSRNLIPCTATGGTNGIGGYYSTCKVPSPFTSTGSLRSLSLECGNTSVSVTAMSGGFIKTSALNFRTLGSAVFTSQIPNFNVNKTFGSGSQVLFGTGGTLWNPADTIVLQTSKVIPGTTTFSCRVRYNVVDKFGS